MVVISVNIRRGRPYRNLHKVQWTRKETTRYTVQCLLAVVVVLFVATFSFPDSAGLYTPLLLLESNQLSPQNGQFISNLEPGSVVCHYHGNCPIGALCAPDGYCHPYEIHSNLRSPSQESSLGSIHKQCVDACMEELVMEEDYLYRSSVQLLETFDVASPLSGCILYYVRQQEEEPRKDRPSLQERLQRRWRRLARVDPHILNDQGQDIWKAVCHRPCQDTNDCETGLLCLPRYHERASESDVSSKKLETSGAPHIKACQAPPAQPQHDMVVVSGAESSYFEALMNLAASLRYWSPTRKLVVYNLGMSESEISEVRKWPNVLALRWPQGIPETYPEHVRENVKNYAWKSIIINETVHEYKSIFWLDAGATFVGSVDLIEEIIHKHGMFLVRGQDEHMHALSHPGTYEWHGFDRETYKTGPHYAGGIQGHVYPSRYIDSVVIPNAKCALDKDCISPPNATLLNHRFDQTSLSILAYQPHIRAPHYTEFLAAGLDQLNANLSAPSEPYLMWTARGGCIYYTETHGGKAFVSKEYAMDQYCDAVCGEKPMPVCETMRTIGKCPPAP